MAAAAAIVIVAAAVVAVLVVVVVSTAAAVIAAAAFIVFVVIFIVVKVKIKVKVHRFQSLYHIYVFTWTSAKFPQSPITTLLPHSGSNHFKERLVESISQSRAGFDLPT